MTTATDRIRSDAADVRIWLIGRIRRGERHPVNYADVTKHLDAWANNGLGPVLDEVASRCVASGEPDLSVMVVNKATGAPGKATLSPDWQSEQQRCIAYWGSTT